MANPELIRIVENIAHDRKIDKESIFADLEDAMASAAKKHFADQTSQFVVHIDRTTGDVSALRNGQPLDIKQLGRISAQAAKQIMVQKIRADERDSIYSEYVKRKGEIISGTVLRYESGNMIIRLNHRTEAVMPKEEQIVGQSHKIGERIQGVIINVIEENNQVKIICSRTNVQFIRRLFEIEVPEINDNIIEIRGIEREPGYRTKVAVASLDKKIDPVGACVGVRGARIKAVVDELNGEKIDIVRWAESSKVFITNAIAPAKVSKIELCVELNRATVVVNQSNLSLAIGKHGQNVRLAARLTGWDIDILTEEEFEQNVEKLERCIKDVEGTDDFVVDKMLTMGLIYVQDIVDVGTEQIVQELKIDSKIVNKIIEMAKIEAVKEKDKLQKSKAQNLVEQMVKKIDVKPE